MGVRLPEEYQEVEYLENSGTQYIITDYVPNIDKALACEMEYAFTAKQKGDQMLFGAVGETSRYCAEKYNDTGWYCGVGTKGFRNVMVPVGGELNIWYKLMMTQELFSIDDNIVEQNITYASSALPEMCLFAWNRLGTIQYINKGLRIYSFICTEDGAVSAHFVPCKRDADDEPGMYDLVSGEFFVNQGTGKFLVGPDVIDSISPWLVARRRGLMRKVPELYPVGTNVVSMYAANWVDDSSWSNTGGTSGISGASRCTDFIPINPKYTYRKNGHRLYNYCCWYDKDKHFIRSFSYNNTTVQDIANIPENARYMRISTYKSSKENLKIIRTA